MVITIIISKISSNSNKVDLQMEQHHRKKNEIDKQT